MSGRTRARPPTSPQNQREACASYCCNMDAKDELEVGDPLARLSESDKKPTSTSNGDFLNSTGSRPKSKIRLRNRKKNKSILCSTNIALRVHGQNDSKGSSESRDPIDLAPDENNSFDRADKATRDIHMGGTKGIHKGLCKKKAQRHIASSAKSKGWLRGTQRRVSFANGDSGNAVTSTNHYEMLYSDEEKAACFYNERDMRRFRAEHYLGINSYDEERPDDDQSYIKAASDFLESMSNLWNSFLDLAYYSLNG